MTAIKAITELFRVSFDRFVRTTFWSAWAWNCLSHGCIAPHLLVCWPLKSYSTPLGAAADRRSRLPTKVPFDRADIWLPHLATWREMALASHEWPWTRARIRRGREPPSCSGRSRFAMPPTPGHHPEPN